MYAFRYHRPENAAAATALVNPDARFIAGGQTLIPTMKQRLAAPGDLIDVARLPELQGIEAGDDSVTIGAATTHFDVATSDVVLGAIPALAALAGSIGDPAVRNLGTIGGSLAANDPAADYPAAALALGATVVTDRRSIAYDDFVTGLFSTVLEDGELILRVVFPRPALAAYEKFRNPASRYAMAGVFVARHRDGTVRAAVTGAGDNGVFRATAIEEALLRTWSPAAVDAVTIDPAGMLGDIHGSSAYRANLVKVVAKRAVARIA